MGTEVLRPQDWLNERLRLPEPVVYYPRRKNYPSGNPRPSWKPASRPEPRRRSKSPAESSKVGKNFVMGQVTILKRGESLDSKKNGGFSARNEVRSTVPSGDLFVSGKERLGPDPAMVKKQIRMTDLKAALAPASYRPDVYAGSAFSLSPAPSSLPLPTFSKKRDIDDSATKDLRRLLRLE